MAEVRERYWKLRRLVKQVKSKCYGCVKFRAQSFQNPPEGRLPTTRTQGSTPFQVLGVDFAGPLRYMGKGKMERKTYLVLYACSLTRAVHMELLISLKVAEFVPSLKRLIAKRGRPEIIYSDNATTFKAAEKWLRLAQKDEKLNLFLTKRKIEWRFNLSRAPCYVEDEIEQPVLTPNKLLHINPNDLPEVKPHQQESTDLRKRAKQLRKYKDQMWRRWTREYIRGLRERHKQRNGGKQSDYPNHGDVVTIESEEKNRNMWKVDPKGELNPAAPEFQPKPRRDAAVAAEVRMQQHVETEEW
ncbi:uncharacterized protein LOC124449302 [Xenia sp. Carnegie-2017]|uniref:uncharacterized protein LOC124449302 n=1 Tax=Xenia sp. Carnegie-2017 TaxID=2897299 RepID=UPI001F03695B|nr:uncharacterized protein LOC124449302 [Xenia sp. Carnegie-2017]